MLKHLEIENYILIEQLEIDFYEGFSVITGETGAGKSILLGALELILGNRADTQVLLDKDKKCTIEGVFHIAGYGMEAFFKMNELDYDEQLILRREITPSGKSRAFINDTPVNLNQMKDLGGRLVNIHSQNSTMTLNQADFQLAVLDSFGGMSDHTAEFRKKYEEYRMLERKLEGMVLEEKNARAEEDYLNFQLEELLLARLAEDEQQQLEESLNLLTHSEEIKDNLFNASGLLLSSDANVLGMLSEVQSMLRKVSAYHPSLAELLKRLESATIELKDIASEIASAESATEFDPEELENLQERLDLIYRLQSKHHVQTISELIEIREKIDSQLQNLSSLEEQINELKNILSKDRSVLNELAESLSKERKKAIPAFELEITGLLRHMGMPHARMQVRMENQKELSKDGIDQVMFVFSANQGHELRPLADVASGGELSRVMLAIKAMISQKNLLPTIIFDEIDNGISGDVAGRVGDILLKTAGKMQLIAITHLPQIAGRASVQYNVVKKLSGQTTVSGIDQLTPEERVVELARMISGNEVTEAARQTARELLNQVSIFDN